MMNTNAMKMYMKHSSFENVRFTENDAEVIAPKSKKQSIDKAGITNKGNMIEANSVLFVILPIIFSK